MSSASTNNNSSSSSAFRVNYSEYVADITGSPKSTRPSATTGIGHHINPLHNPYPNRQNQPTQQTGGMPQYGGGSDKCARCSKTVYVAEKKVGAGRSFHSSCFSCNTCKRKLDSTALSEHKGEIYCKSCYTKQFGAHGLISGVTMSTEQTTRRSSFGTDLDTAGVTNQPIWQRTYSNDNVFRDESGARQSDTSPKKSPQRNNNILPEPNSPSKRNDDGVNAIIDTKYQRSPSPVSGGNSNVNDNRHRSTYIEEDDRNKYVYEGQKMSYGSGASAVVDIPVISQNKQSNSTINRFELPTEPTRNQQRSRSPSITSNDSYRRQNSRERTTDPTDEYSRLTINEDTNNRKYSSGNPLNTIVSENPTTRNSSYASTYENKHQSTISNSTNNSDREQYHSRESSPTTYRNRSPSPTAGYVSSTIRTTTSSTYRGTSPPSSYAPQYNYRNPEISSTSSYTDRRSPSPQSNNRTPSGLNDFVTKTNLAGNIPSSNGNKNSTLGSLVGNLRQQTKPNDDDDWVD